MVAAPVSGTVAGVAQGIEDTLLPGSSNTNWALYIGLAAVGLLFVFGGWIGAEVRTVKLYGLLLG